jgi:copper transport protein
VTRRSRALTALAAVAAVLALPASAWAHAALLHTVPSASGTVNTPPRQVELTYSEAVEPRFAIVSVTDQGAHRMTTGPPRRSAANPDTLVVPLKHLKEGWYLVYWRVISVDGHPVRSAFTFAVGPNPGPQPQFVIPSISETAATPRLLIARWAVFLSLFAAIGLFALRIAIARPVVRRVPGTSLRPLSVAFFIAAAVALVAVPVYDLLATAEFALRSVFSIGSLIPLMRDSAFGRGYLDLELCVALFVAAGAVAIYVDRPERKARSVAEIVALLGAALAASAALIVPGASGHAAQTSPRGLSLLFDATHLLGGSLWLGGLIGLLVLWQALPAARRLAGLAVVVPRFSNVAFLSVMTLLATGTGASILHLPTIASLWTTSYGQAIVVKVALLGAAMLLGAVNLLLTKPRLVAAQEGRVDGSGAAQLLRRLVGCEVLIVAGAIFAAAILSSLAPPAKALAEVGHAAAKVGPGPVTQVVRRAGYTLRFRLSPNRAAVPNTFQVAVTRNGQPVQSADITVTFAMLDMEMGNQEYRLEETAPGVYTRASSPALVMVGHWGLSFDVTPKSGTPFNVLLVDHATG